MSISTNQDSGSQLFGSPVSVINNINSMHFNVGKFYEGSTFGSIKSDSNQSTSREKCQKYLKSFEQAQLLVRHITPPPRLEFGFQNTQSIETLEFNPLETRQTQQSIVRTEAKIASIESSIPLVKVASCAVNSEAFSSRKGQQQYSAVNNFDTHQISEPFSLVKRKYNNYDLWSQIKFNKERKFQIQEQKIYISPTNLSLKVYDSITLSSKRSSLERLKSLIQRSIQTSPPLVKNFSYTKETINQSTQCEPIAEILSANKTIIAFRDATIILLIIVLISQIIQIIFEYFL